MLQLHAAPPMTMREQGGDLDANAEPRQGCVFQTFISVSVYMYFFQIPPVPDLSAYASKISLSFSPNGAALCGLAPAKINDMQASFCETIRTSEDTTLPADLWLPRTGSFELPTRELVEPVFQTEGEDLFEIVVWSLGLLGVGESSDGNAGEDGLARWLVGENKSGWTVADCRDRLRCQYESMSCNAEEILHTFLAA